MTNKEITNAYYGADQVEKIYLGSEVIWPAGSPPTPPTPPHDYSQDYLTFEITSPGKIVWIFRQEYSGQGAVRTIQYRNNGGEWNTITSSLNSDATYFYVDTGDIVEFKGTNNNYGFDSGYRTDNMTTNNFEGTTCGFKVYGNIMSLVYGDNFSGQTVIPSGSGPCFEGLFYTCTGLTECQNLVLPTGLAQSCYMNLFRRCTGLTSIFDALPATTLQRFCYYGMFSWTGINSIPSHLLPATVLADNCYGNMFGGCVNLTDVRNLELPCTDFSGVMRAYVSMFSGCSGLTAGPDLNATGDVGANYSNMFMCGFTINYEKILTTVPPQSTVFSSSPGVMMQMTSQGTLVKHPNATFWTNYRGNNASVRPTDIPMNWTIVDAT